MAAAATLLHPAELLTPTGLKLDDVRALPAADKRALAEWHGRVSGDDDGRQWWPYAIRRMPVQARLKLAYDDGLFGAWCEREKRRVARDHVYFTIGYGHVQPEEGPAVPFLLWPEQADALRAFREHLRIVILKARQLGLTWLALHDAAHVLAFDGAYPNARILALSKHGQDATKLLERERRIFRLLPEFLRPVEDSKTRDSKTELKLQGRGKMVSLAGTPDAARMETATLVLCDEFAHIRNRGAEGTWTALIPTMGRRGRAIVIFTGNGSAESPGDGQTAARLWQRARAGSEDENGAGHLHPIFLASSIDRTRDEAFMDAKRQEFLTDQDFRAEYAETEEDALAGRTEQKVYSPAGINAAERLGREYDLLLEQGKMPPPLGDRIKIGIDWGEFTFGLVIWPLEAGGIYVCPGEYAPKGAEPGDCAIATLEAARAVQTVRDDGTRYPLVAKAAFDAAGIQSMRTYVKVVEGRPDLLEAVDTILRYRPELRRKVRSIKKQGVPFGEFKHETVNYYRRLFRRAELGMTTGIIAISPRNVDLLRQLRGLETIDDGTGRVKKGDDHGPDGLVAGGAETMARFRGLYDVLDDDAQADDEPLEAVAA